MATTADINVGSIIRFNNELCVITEYQHRTPGNLRAFYQAKMKNLKTGNDNRQKVRQKGDRNTQTESQRKRVVNRESGRMKHMYRSRDSEKAYKQRQIV